MAQKPSLLKYKQKIVSLPVALCRIRCERDIIRNIKTNNFDLDRKFQLILGEYNFFEPKFQLVVANTNAKIYQKTKFNLETITFVKKLPLLLIVLINDYQKIVRFQHHVKSLAGFVSKNS